MQPDSATVHTVTSTDGTEIAYERRGDGHPVVLLHGGSATRESLAPLAGHLSTEFATYAVDRRGRGDSGDADEHSLDREVADLRAVCEAVDGTPTVFGHSFGGLVTLAAASDLPAERVVLYEPALLTGDHREGGDLAVRMQERLDDGRRLDALELFYREAGGIPDPDRLPFWPDEAPLDLVETVVRENRAVEAYDVDDAEVPVPTLLLTGERGPVHLRDGVRTLAEELDDARVVELEGVGHVGTEEAPDRVADAVREFVAET